ncbi:MAG: hypothetical protein ABI520_11685 [Caldimonas sp.]
MKSFLLRAWRRTTRRVGLAGPVAGLLLLVAAALALALPRLESERRIALLDVATRTASMHAPGTAVIAERGEDRLARYVEAFPLASQMAADLGGIYESAERHHVSLPKGEYQLKSEPGSPFETYAVTLPIHAEYGLVKGFAASVLLALPHASLDDLRLSREGSDVEVLDAVVRFTLVYRSR